jgi:lysophospholipase L1-like esterase
MTEPAAFAYSNLSDRPSGTLLRLARRVVPGLGAVGAQVAPYAEAWRRRNVAALAASGPLWVVLGDSLCQGIGASSVERGWVLQTAARLGDDGVALRIVNLSVSGARVEELIDRQLPALEALGVQPDVVSVMIGSNDLIRRRYRERLPAALERLVGLVPPGSLIATMPAVDRGFASIINPIVDRAVQQRGLVAVPFEGGPGMRAADHFHPNDAGYAAMARPYVAAVGTALRRATAG